MISQDDIEAMRGPSLLGISGRIGSGKSEAAKTLIDGGWVNIKMAGPLKDMLRAIGLTDRHIEGDLKEVPCDILGGQTPRHAMKTLGKEWGRECIHPDLWTILARARIVTALAAGCNVVVDDVRFENEAALIRDLGGLVLGIDRGGQSGGHVSEGGIMPDILYKNTGTLAELRGYVQYVFMRCDI